MSTIATAYVQVLPSTKGIKGQLTSEFSGAGTDAGKAMGSSVTSSLMSSLGTGALLAAGTAIGAALVKGISSSIQEGGALQQSIGGIQTLFKESADTVMQNASEAWKTAGISANEYMEQTTSFGASLIKSLGDDTRKAAQLADTAILDMSDNANKMGTDIQMIQNAYQGFAKGNFTMLDNLKLGYGGTKQEMEKLLQEATKLSGVKYDINNFGDIVAAIHEIQTELGITGTTAKEASETLTGSFASVKAALKDVLGGMALGGDISKQLDNLGESFSTFFNDNLLPMIDNAVSSLPDIISKLVESLTGNGASDAISKITSIGIKLASGLVKGLGEIVAAAPLIIMRLVEGLIQAAPELAKAIPDMIKSLAEAIPKYAPEIAKEIPKLVIAMAEALVMSAYYLVDGLAEVMAELISQVPQYASDMAAAFSSYGPTIAEAFQNWGTNISTAIQPAVASISEKFGPAISAISDKLAPLVSSFQNMFTQIGAFAKACAELVVTAFTPLIQRIGSVFSSILSAIKSAFSPITNFMSQIAQQIVSALKNTIAQFRAIGKQMIENLKQGIMGAIDGVIQSLKEKVDAIADLFRGLTDTVTSATSKITSEASAAQKTTQSVSGSVSKSMSRTYSSSSASALNSAYVERSNSIQPVNVNVTLSGSAKTVFDSVQVENTKLVTATGYHALA